MDGNNRTIWIIGGVIVLILLAFFLFGNRPVEEAATATQEAASVTVQSADIAAARVEAAADLTALRARQEAGETYAELQDDYAAVRTRLGAAYANAEGEAQQEWAELQTDFDQFEASARANTGGFLERLSILIGRLAADARVESAGE
ncbi:MAG: hypothetical protein AAB582_03345 [Patescibacteria group bacterium]